MKKILLIIPFLLLLISCGSNNTSTSEETITPSEPTTPVDSTTPTEPTPSETIVYDQKNTDPKFLKSAADCEHPAVYYYSSLNGDIGTETFEYGVSLGHNYVNNICTRCNAYNDDLDWGPLH